MQDKERNSIKLKMVYRVYPSRSKAVRNKSLLPRHQDNEGDVTSNSEGSHTRAATPQNIDLPFSSLEVNSSLILMQDSFPLPSLVRKSVSSDISSKLPKELPSNNEHLNSTSIHTVTKTSPVPVEYSESVFYENEQECSNKHNRDLRRWYMIKDTTEREDECGNLVENEDKSVIQYVKKNMVRDKGKNEQPFCARKLKRPQHQVVGFLEDHTEFGSDWLEMVEDQGKHCPTVLESTVDGTIVKGARRSYGSRSKHSRDPALLFNNTVSENDSRRQDSLISLDKSGLKTEQHQYKCSVCEVTSRIRQDVEEHIAASDTSHKEAVVLVLLGSQARGRSCPICNIRLQRVQLFKHIRNAHGDSFPLRCGYCVFLGQDYYQLRHHIRNKHGTSRYHIIDVPRLLAENCQQEGSVNLSASGEEATGEEVEEHVSTHHENILMCPLCGKALKTLSNLKKHIIQHSRQKRQCSLCSFTTTFPTQIRSHYRRRHPTQTPDWQTIVVDKGGSNALAEDVTPYLRLITKKYGIRQPKKEGKWMRQYRCPHCEYTCNFNSSYNRHVRLHSGEKPYKCGYCDFHAREAYVIRKHCSKVHKGKKPLIEDDKNFKAPYRYGSKLKKEKEEKDCVGSEEGNVKYLKNSTVPSVTKAKEREAESPTQTKKIRLETQKDVKAKKSQKTEYLSNRSLLNPLLSESKEPSSNKNSDILHEESENEKSQVTSVSQHSNSLNLLPSYGVPFRQEKTNCEIVGDGYVSCSTTQISENTTQETRIQETHSSEVTNLNNLTSLKSTFPCDHQQDQQSERSIEFSLISVSNSGHRDERKKSVQKDTFTNKNAKYNENSWPHAHVSENIQQKHLEDASGHDPSQGVPSEGLENNLRSHITFLSDQRTHCISNCVSATPGVMTRDLLDLDYTNNDYFSTDKVRLMMEREDGRVRCRVCGITTTYRAFYKHAKKHFNIKPFKCGYCSYRSIEKSKIRVHNTFCHPNRPYIILKLSPESAGIDCNVAGVEDTVDKIVNASRDGGWNSDQVTSFMTVIAENSLDLTENISSSPCSKKSEKLESTMKTSRSSRKKCSASVSTLPATFSSSQRQSPFQCPICLKVLQKHTPSIRRHMYSHYGYKPYKCGYCSFTGIGQSEIRAHHVTHGLNVPPKVEESGATVPAGLNSCISDMIPSQRGAWPAQKKRIQASLQSSVQDGVQPSEEIDSSKKADTAVKALTTIYVSEVTE